MSATTRPVVACWRSVGSSVVVPLSRPGFVRSVELQDPAPGPLLEVFGVRWDGTASPPVNITCNEDRSKRSSASELHIITNCALTQQSTVTRCCSMGVVVRSAEKWDGNDTPRAQPDRRRVRGPDPEAKRRGDRGEEHTATAQSTVAHGDLVEVPPPVLRVHHDLGQSRRARRRVHEEQIVGPHRPLGRVPTL